MQFLFPGVLYGLFAISIPILIHLFNFRKYKTVYFSNTLYLKDIKQNSKSKNKLKHLLILLARMLTIIFLVFAFAKPFIPTEEQIQVSKDQVVGIYVDNSFSMEAESKYGKLIDVAKKRAIDVAKSFDASTKFLFFSNERKVIHNHLVNAEQVQEFVEQTQNSPFFLKLSEVQQHFQHQVEMISNNKEIAKRLYVISDFQKNSVDFQHFNADSLLSFVFIPLSTQEVNNIYIDSCWFGTPYRKYQSEETLNVRISNHSNKAYNDIPITFYINDSVRAFAGTSLKPNSSKVEQIKYTNTAKGPIACRVELQDYPIIHDNTYYFSYHIANKIRLLSIYENQENKNLEILFGLDDYFVFNRQQAKYLNFSELGSYDAIILNELESLSNVLVNQLLNYVREGGRLVVIPGPEIAIDSYNLFLGAVGANLISQRDTSETQIDNVNFLSDVYVASFNNEADEHLLPKIKYYYPNASYTSSRSEVLLQANNALPLLLSNNYFKGDVFMFYFSHSKNKNSFNIHPLYVPTFYNVALNTKTNRSLAYTLGNINHFTLKRKADQVDEVAYLKNMHSDFEFIPRIEQGQEIKIFLQNQLTEAGNYALTSNHQLIDVVSFNYDKRESRLSYYDNKTLQERAALHNINNLSLIDNADTGFEYSLSKTNQGTQLWYYFVLLALLFVLLEILIIKLMK